MRADGRLETEALPPPRASCDPARLSDRDVLLSSGDPPPRPHGLRHVPLRHRIGPCLRGGSPSRTFAAGVPPTRIPSDDCGRGLENSGSLARRGGLAVRRRLVGCALPGRRLPGGRVGEDVRPHGLRRSHPRGGARLLDPGERDGLPGPRDRGCRRAGPRLQSPAALGPGSHGRADRLLHDPQREGVQRLPARRPAGDGVVRLLRPPGGANPHGGLLAGCRSS